MLVDNIKCFDSLPIDHIYCEDYIATDFSVHVDYRQITVNANVAFTLLFNPLSGSTLPLTSKIVWR
jgi:hypothetical protein